MLERVPTGLTVPQYRVLSLLDAGDERSTALAQRLAVSKPAISTAVDSLVALGHLLRRGDEDDRRVSWLQITRSGREAVRVADDALVGRLGEVLEHAESPAPLVDALGLLGEVVEADLGARWATGVRG